jgi:hypothetical protein
MKNNFDDLIISLNAMGRILPQQQEVGPLAALHGSNVPAEPQCFGIGERRCAKDLRRRLA